MSMMWTAFVEEPMAKEGLACAVDHVVVEATTYGASVTDGHVVIFAARPTIFRDWRCLLLWRW